MNIVAIVQARMGSTRLPGKVMRPLLEKPILLHVLDRINRVKSIHRIVVATTVHQQDDPIDRLAREHGYDVYRGSEEDVLDRYYHAARAYGADVVVRITADCPLIAPSVIEQVLEYYLRAEGAYDYVSNTLVRTYPRGMDTEVFAFESLHVAWKEARDPASREHVTLYIYRQPDRFRLGSVTYPQDLSSWRLTVDTIEDFELVKRVIESLYPQKPQFDFVDIIDVLERHPEWRKINQHIRQKEV